MKVFAKYVTGNSMYFVLYLMRSYAIVFLWRAARLVLLGSIRGARLNPRSQTLPRQPVLPVTTVLGYV